MKKEYTIYNASEFGITANPQSLITALQDSEFTRVKITTLHQISKIEVIGLMNFTVPDLEQFAKDYNCAWTIEKISEENKEINLQAYLFLQMTTIVFILSFDELIGKPPHYKGSVELAFKNNKVLIAKKY